MDFPGRIELLPIISELKLLGVDQDWLVRMLWFALTTTQAQGNLSYDDFRTLVKHWYKEDKTDRVRREQVFLEAFNCYKQLLLYPLNSQLSLSCQAWMEHCISAYLGVRQSQKLLFEGMEEQLSSPPQRPYFDLLSVLFGPKGNNWYEQVYQIGDVEAYMRAVELGRMPIPVNHKAFAKGLLQSYQMEKGLDTKWFNLLISTIDQKLEALSEQEQIILRLCYGLQGEPKRTKLEVSKAYGFSESAQTNRLKHAFQKLRKAAAVRRLIPTLAQKR